METPRRQDAKSGSGCARRSLGKEDVRLLKPYRGTQREEASPPSIA